MATAQPVLWPTLPSTVTTADAQVEIRVYDGFEVRDVLKDRFGFKFDDSNKTWYAFRPADGFDFQRTLEVLSFLSPRLIEVRDDRRQVIHSAGSRLRSANQDLS